MRNKACQQVWMGLGIRTVLFAAYESPRQQTLVRIERSKTIVD